MILALKHVCALTIHTLNVTKYVMWMADNTMIRNHRLIDREYRVLKRTYDRQDWNENRMRYIDEARNEARTIRPGRVELYVREEKRHKPVKMVVIKAH